MPVVGFATPFCRVLTGIASCLTRVLCSLTLTYMLTLDRDRQIVLSVARFGQLTAGHIRSMLFHGLTDTPADRALSRLVERRYLARIERRMVGGNGAGSGQYVYQLGSAGWAFVGRPGRYYPYRAVNYHTLAIADAYVALQEQERMGRIEIEAFVTEPDSWMAFEGVELRPDMRVEITDRFNGERYSMWLEVDMGTERPTQIREKLRAYWKAYWSSDETAMSDKSVVTFVAPDDERVKLLNWVIEGEPEEAQTMFAAFNLSNFAPIIFG